MRWLPLILVLLIVVSTVLVKARDIRRAEAERESLRAAARPSGVDFQVAVPAIQVWNFDPPPMPSFDLDPGVQKEFEDTNRRLQESVNETARRVQEDLGRVQDSLQEDQRRARAIPDIARGARQPGRPPVFPGAAAAGAVEVVNPGDDAVAVRLVCLGRGAREFSVAPGGRFALPAPAGSYQAFFLFASLPGQVFRGDDFSVTPATRVRITLTRGGDYRIRRVR